MTMVFWNWWILAGLLVLIEIITPGFVFIWLGISAAVTGAIVYFWPELDWHYQLVVFAALAIESVVVWILLRKRLAKAGDQPGLNRRGEQHVGKTFMLVEAIDNGRGRIKIGDGTWIVEGDDMPLGAKVRVTSVDGAVLRVVDALDRRASEKATEGAPEQG